MSAIHTYSVANDTLNGKVDQGSLYNELIETNIQIALSSVAVVNDVITISYASGISASEIITVTSIVNTHEGVELQEPELEIDSDGRQVTKQAATVKGWSYMAHPVEITTAKLTGCYSADWQGAARPGFSMKFYNEADQEITSGSQSDLDSDCVKTTVTISPDHDYELISGNIHQKQTPTTNVRIWVIGGAVELGALGTKEFVGGINMAYLGSEEQIETDGRASKHMKKTTTGVPYNTNQIQFIITHNAGYQHDLMLILEYFRA